MIFLDSVSKSYQVTERGAGAGVFMPSFLRPSRQIRALEDISLSIAEGESVGCAGTTGAGKSTLIRLMLGLIPPTRGKVYVLGRDPARHRRLNAREVGAVIAHECQLAWELPIIESYLLLKRRYDIPEETFASNLKELRSVLGLRGVMRLSARQLSVGERMRAELAGALLHDPKILFLDEPTMGIDEEAGKQIRGLIRDIQQEKRTTVVLTTHNLADVQEICDRIILLHQGRIVLDGELDAVQEAFGRSLGEIVRSVSSGDLPQQ